jgi:hypothetical protein
MACLVLRVFIVLYGGLHCAAFVTFCGWTLALLISSTLVPVVVARVFRRGQNLASKEASSTLALPAERKLCQQTVGYSYP